MLNKIWLFFLCQVVWAGTAFSTTGKPAAKGHVRSLNYAPEAVSFEVEVEQRLDNHERRLGRLEKVSGTPVAVRPKPASTPQRPSGRPAEPKKAVAAATHTVKSGETAFSIARRHRISVAELMKANRLTAAATIHPGQKLRLPGAITRPPDPPVGGERYGYRAQGGKPETRYTVRSGDTVSSLARRNGVTEQELMRLNGLKDPTKLQIGSVLRLPSATTAPEENEADEPATRVVETEEPLPDGWHWHHVRQGESLSQIASRYGTDRRAIERANDLTGGSAALREGVVLKIPPPEMASTERATPLAKPHIRRWTAEGDESVLGYTVQKGDSLESVAQEFKTSTSILRRLNRLGKTETLVAGRRIVVPNTIFE